MKYALKQGPGAEARSGNGEQRRKRSLEQEKTPDSGVRSTIPPLIQQSLIREALADGTVAFWGPAKVSHALFNAYQHYEQQRVLYG